MKERKGPQNNPEITGDEKSDTPFITTELKVWTAEQVAEVFDFALPYLEDMGHVAIYRNKVLQYAEDIVDRRGIDNLRAVVATHPNKTLAVMLEAGRDDIVTPYESSRLYKMILNNESSIVLPYIYLGKHSDPYSGEDVLFLKYSNVTKISSYSQGEFGVRKGFAFKTTGNGKKRLTKPPEGKKWFDWGKDLLPQNI